jgi:hypothetical protein
VSWAAKRQHIVALSTTEAEYIAATEAAKEAVWLQNLIRGLGASIDRPTLLRGDNAGAISLLRNPEFHSRSKHIDIRFHFIYQCVSRVYDPRVRPRTYTKARAPGALGCQRKKEGFYPDVATVTSDSTAERYRGKEEGNSRQAEYSLHRVRAGACIPQ